MKKLLVLIVVIFIALSSSACVDTSEDALSDTFDISIKGTVNSIYDNSNSFPAFQLMNDSGLTGFVIYENTVLIWQDETVITEMGYDADVQADWSIFNCNLIVSVVPGDEAEIPGVPARWYPSKWYYAEKVTVTGIQLFDPDAGAAKPVIYLYPENETVVDVTLDYSGELTCTYPAYENGWTVTASPDGILTDKSGQTYNYLYWEGVASVEYDFSEGFCIAGEDTAAFLEDALSRLGLTRREANEFIVYWLPLMEMNPYNLISFQTDAYTDSARLTVDPAPDTLIRVFMAWQGIDTPIEVNPQTLTSPERIGFTLVEWGGCQVE